MVAGLPPVSLEDKYRFREGRVFMSGVQALVRLPLVQKWRDTAAGLNTGGFISGYRGSPLGGYDQELWRAKKWLKEQDISVERFYKKLLRVIFLQKLAIY